jgi:hypothetical protein
MRHSPQAAAVAPGCPTLATHFILRPVPPRTSHGTKVSLQEPNAPKTGCLPL